MDWIDLLQDKERRGGSFEWVKKPPFSIKCGNFLTG
jgi:hypothetical protein